jgi:hypothetical protein
MARKIRKSIDLEDVDLEEVQKAAYSKGDDLYIELSDGELYFVKTSRGRIAKDKVQQELKSLDSPSANDKLNRLRDRAGDSGN